MAAGASGDFNLPDPTPWGPIPPAPEPSDKPTDNPSPWGPIRPPTPKQGELPGAFPKAFWDMVRTTKPPQLPQYQYHITPSAEAAEAAAGTNQLPEQLPGSREPDLATNHFSFGMVTDLRRAGPSERRRKKKNKKKGKDNN